MKMQAAQPQIDRSGEARQRILRSALKYFAAGGLHGTSLREISKNAEVPLSALHYYFGSKESLFIATFEHFFGILTAERSNLLQELLNQGGKVTVQDIVQAFVEPILHIAASESGPDYLRLQLRVFEDREVGEKLLLTTGMPATHLFLNAFEKVLPGVSLHQLVRGYRQMVWGVTNVIFDPFIDNLTNSPAMPAESERTALLDELVIFYTAGFMALSGIKRPVSPKT